MSEELKEFVHERFRRADEKSDRVMAILLGVVERFASLEKQVAGLRVDFAHLREDLVRIDQRLDKVDDKLARIERRLDLVDAT